MRSYVKLLWPLVYDVHICSGWAAQTWNKSTTATISLFYSLLYMLLTNGANQAAKLTVLVERDDSQHLAVLGKQLTQNFTHVNFNSNIYIYRMLPPVLWHCRFGNRHVGWKKPAPYPGWFLFGEASTSSSNEQYISPVWVSGLHGHNK